MLNFIESNSIYASDEEFNESHSVCFDMKHAEIGQFVESLFENNWEDIYSILIKGDFNVYEIYFSTYGIFDTF